MIKKLHVKVAILEISNQLMKLYDFTNCLTKRQRRPETRLTHSRSRFANVKILSSMGFRFGFSIDIHAKIQNFKSIAAMQLFLWSLCYSR